MSSAFKTKNNKDQGLGTSYIPEKLLADWSTVFTLVPKMSFSSEASVSRL